MYFSNVLYAADFIEMHILLMNVLTLSVNHAFSSTFVKTTIGKAAQNVELILEDDLLSALLLTRRFKTS